jgi:hypothetical protein
VVRHLDDVGAGAAVRHQERLPLLLEVAEEEHPPAPVGHGDHQGVVVERAHRVGRRDRQRAVAVVVDRPQHLELDAALAARHPERRVDYAGAVPGQPAGDRRQVRHPAAAPRPRRLRRGPGDPQLVDRHPPGERDQAQVVIGVGVRDDRDVEAGDPAARQDAADRLAGGALRPRRRLRRHLAARVHRLAAGVDQPGAAAGQLDQRRVALADVEEGDPQLVAPARLEPAGRERAAEQERAGERRDGGAPPGRAPRPGRRGGAADQEGEEPRDLEPPRRRHLEDRGQPGQQARAVVDQRGDRHAGVDQPAARRAGGVEHEAREDRRDHHQLDGGRQHEVAEDAAERDLVEVPGGDRRRRRGDPGRGARDRADPARQAAQPAPPARRRRLLRVGPAAARDQAQGGGGDEGQLERRIPQGGGSLQQQHQRRQPDRVEHGQPPAQDHAAEHHEHRDQRAQGRGLPAGEQGVGHRRRRGEERGDPRPVETRRQAGHQGPGPADRHEEQHRDHRQVQAADAERVVDAGGPPGVVGGARDAAAIADHRAADDRVALGIAAARGDPAGRGAVQPGGQPPRRGRRRGDQHLHLADRHLQVAALIGDDLPAIDAAWVAEAGRGAEAATHPHAVAGERGGRIEAGIAGAADRHQHADVAAVELDEQPGAGRRRHRRTDDEADQLVLAAIVGDHGRRQPRHARALPRRQRRARERRDDHQRRRPAPPAEPPPRRRQDQQRRRRRPDRRGGREPAQGGGSGDAGGEAEGQRRHAHRRPRPDRRA